VRVGSSLRPAGFLGVVAVVPAAVSIVELVVSVKEVCRTGVDEEAGPCLRCEGITGGGIVGTLFCSDLLRETQTVFVDGQADENTCGE